MKNIIDNPPFLIIALAWATFLLYWGLSAVRTKSVQNLVAAILMVVALVGLVLLLRSAGTGGDVNPELWRRALPHEIISDVIVLAGLFVGIWARRTLGSQWNATAKGREDQE